jgi:hypothetical protein
MQNFFRQMGGSIGIACLDTLLTRFGAQNYNDLLTHANSLNPVAYQTYHQAMSLPSTHLSSSVGLWSAQTLAVKSLSHRVGQQAFAMSFEQLCWVIMAIVACGLIPLYLIQPTVKPSGKMPSAH